MATKVVLTLFKDGERKDFPLRRGIWSIGRHPDCLLQIPAKEVSRKHCELTIGEGGVSVADMESANGTYVNGQRVRKKSLRPGDQLRIGPATFVVQIDGKPEKITPIDGVEPKLGAAARMMDEDDEGDLIALDDDDKEIDLNDLATAIDDDDEDEPRR